MKPRVFFLVAGLILAHLLLHVAFGFGKGAPDLLVVALLVASHSLSMRTGAALGFALGLLEDGFSMLSFGANVFAMTLAGAAGARSRDFFVGDSVPFLAIYFLLGKWVRDLLVWVVTDPAGRPVFNDHMFVESPLLALYAAAAGVLARLLIARGPLS